MRKPLLYAHINMTLTAFDIKGLERGPPIKAQRLRSRPTMVVHTLDICSEPDDQEFVEGGGAAFLRASSR